jgi:hypothetical protein
VATQPGRASTLRLERVPVSAIGALAKAALAVAKARRKHG